MSVVLLLPEGIAGEMGEDGSYHDAAAEEDCSLEPARDVLGWFVPATDFSCLNLGAGTGAPNHLMVNRGGVGDRRYRLGIATRQTQWWA